jgi:DNA-binding FadR family transcriptional regulator
MARRLRSEHRGIVAAISAGDAASAHTRIHDHISGYYRDAAPEQSVARAEAAPSPVLSAPQTR